jgi:hypothetical protein
MSVLTDQNQLAFDFELFALESLLVQLGKLPPNRSNIQLQPVCQAKLNVTMIGEDQLGLAHRQGKNIIPIGQDHRITTITGTDGLLRDLKRPKSCHMVLDS